MSAEPARYRYESAFEQQPYTRIDVIRGSTPPAQPALSPKIFLAAKIAVFALVLIFVLSFVRIGLASATTSTLMQSQELGAQIDDARSLGTSLEVSQSSLSNPTKIKEKATELDMAAPASVGIIDIGKDVVVLDDTGALSLSKSMAVLANTEA